MSVDPPWWYPNSAGTKVAYAWILCSAGVVEGPYTAMKVSEDWTWTLPTNARFSLA